jgi:hypothetical protein
MSLQFLNVRSSPSFRPLSRFESYHEGTKKRQPTPNVTPLLVTCRWFTTDPMTIGEKPISARCVQTVRRKSCAIQSCEPYRSVRRESSKQPLIGLTRIRSCRISRQCVVRSQAQALAQVPGFLNVVHSAAISSSDRYRSRGFDTPPSSIPVAGFESR